MGIRPGRMWVLIAGLVAPFSGPWGAESEAKERTETPTVRVAGISGEVPDGWSEMRLHEQPMADFRYRDGRKLGLSDVDMRLLLGNRRIPESFSQWRAFMAGLCTRDRRSAMDEEAHELGREMRPTLSIDEAGGHLILSDRLAGCIGASTVEGFSARGFVVTSGEIPNGVGIVSAGIAPTAIRVAAAIRVGDQRI